MTKLSLQEVQDQLIEELCEEVSANIVNTTGPAIDMAPTGRRIQRRGKTFGTPTFEVDSNTYSKFMKGKTKGVRWNKYIEDDGDFSPEVKKQYSRHKRMIIRNETTGAMVYLK